MASYITYSFVISGSRFSWRNIGFTSFYMDLFEQALLETKRIFAPIHITSKNSYPRTFSPIISLQTLRVSSFDYYTLNYLPMHSISLILNVKCAIDLRI